MTNGYPPIVKVIQYYFPDWEPPEDNPPWMKCLCPFHGEARPSATVSYELNAFTCFACDTKGNVTTLIMQHERLDYATAVNRAKEILGSRYGELQVGAARQPRRAAPFGSRPNGLGSGRVPSRVLRRTTPWA